MGSLSNFVYCSKIAPSADISCVSDIIKVARTFNKEHQITGMLIFDGVRFCQYIEGPHEPLQSLISSISKDPRHTDFTPKLAFFDQKTRMFSQWSMAYVLVDDSEPLDNIEAVQGTAMLDKLQSLLPMLDIA